MCLVWYTILTSWGKEYEHTFVRGWEFLLKINWPLWNAYIWTLWWQVSMLRRRKSSLNITKQADVTHGLDGKCLNDIDGGWYTLLMIMCI